MSAGRFFEAIEGSSAKNSLPSTRILDIDLPLAVILPSEPTSTPGRRLSRSSTTAFGWVLKDAAAYSIVSSFTVIGVRTPTTVASFSNTEPSFSSKGFRRMSLSPTVMSRSCVSYPIYDASTIYLPGLTFGIVYLPLSFVTTPPTRLESRAARRRTEAWIRPSPVDVSFTFPESVTAVTVVTLRNAKTIKTKNFLNSLFFILQNYANTRNAESATLH